MLQLQSAPSHRHIKFLSLTFYCLAGIHAVQDAVRLTLQMVLRARTEWCSIQMPTAWLHAKVRIYACMYLCMCCRRFARMYVYVHAYIHIHIYLHCVHVCVLCPLQKRTAMLRAICMCVHMNLFTHKHAYTQVLTTTSRHIP